MYATAVADSGGLLTAAGIVEGLRHEVVPTKRGGVQRSVAHGGGRTATTGQPVAIEIGALPAFAEVLGQGSQRPVLEGLHGAGGTARQGGDRGMDRSATKRRATTSR